MNPFGRMANASREAGPKEKDDGSGGSSGVRLPDAAMADLSVAHGGMAVPGELRVEVMLASFAFPQFTLQPLSFTLRSGEVLAILGPNASGKSTLLGLLSGILPPLSGQVRLDGREMSRLDLRRRAQRVAVVQQESPLLFPVLVADYVLQGRHPHLRPLQLETEADYDAVARALEATSAAHLRHRWMQGLSGGEKQRVILARALAQQPEVLLLDEPTLHLDIGAQVDLLRLVRSLAARENYAVAVVTHELNLAAEFADRILLMHRGRMVRLGPPAEVFERELLEEVFETELDVLVHPATGRPRVVLRSEEITDEGGGKTPLS